MKNGKRVSIWVAEPEHNTLAAMASDQVRSVASQARILLLTALEEARKSPAPRRARRAKKEVAA